MEQLQAVIQSQAVAIQQLQQDLAHVQSALVQAQQAALHAPSAAGPSASHSPGDASGDSGGLSRLMNKPSLFHGDFGDTSIHTWVLEMDGLFRNFAANTPESRKVSFALSQLRDQALRWWNMREVEVRANTPNGPQACTTWDELKAAMIQAFQSRGKSASARSELRNLRQWHFRSLSGYIRAFEEIAQRIEVPAGQSIHEELVSNFKEGLTDGQVRLALTQSQPRTLLQATQMALQAESDLRVSGASSRGPRRGLMPYRGEQRARSERFSTWRSTSYGNGQRNGSPATSYSSSSTERSTSAVPMELGAMASSRHEESEADSDADEERGVDDREHASDSEEPVDSLENDCEPTCENCGCNAIQMRSRKPTGPPVCWNCGQSGHISRDCKAPKRVSMSRMGPPRPDKRSDDARESDRGRRRNFH